MVNRSHDNRMADDLETSEEDHNYVIMAYTYMIEFKKLWSSGLICIKLPI
jgi:hypothetical protein